MMKYSYDQVFQLFIEKLSGNLSPDNEILVGKMLAEDKSFKATWHALEEESNELNVSGFLENIDVETELASVKQKIQPYMKPASTTFSIQKLMAAAAILLIVLTGSYLIFFKDGKIVDKEQIAAAVEKNKQSISLVLANGSTVTLNKDSPTNKIALPYAAISTGNGTLQYSSEDTTQNTLWVPEGENYKIVLSDGSEVTLNAATRLRFPFKFYGGQREVFIEGEAFFKVAKDAKHPFIVHTAQTQVQVLGTSFNVNTYQQGNVKTALVEGKVTTKSNDGKTMALAPGFEADYEQAKGFESGSFDASDVLSWMDGVYYFHNMPLTELAKLASRCYGIKIVLDNTSLSGKSITGLLDKNKLTDFLNDLEKTSGIKYYYSGNELYLR